MCNYNICMARINVFICNRCMFLCKFHSAIYFLNNWRYRVILLGYINHTMQNMLIFRVFNQAIIPIHNKAGFQNCDASQIICKMHLSFADNYLYLLFVKCLYAYSSFWRFLSHLFFIPKREDNKFMKMV